MKTFTVVLSRFDSGTYVTTVDACDIEIAKETAVIEVVEWWGLEDSGDVEVLGVIAGRPEILEWEGRCAPW